MRIIDTGAGLPVRTRLAGLGVAYRLLLTAAMLLLIGWSIAIGPGPAPRRADHADQGDAALYRAINRRVMAGENYYAAAAAEHRRRGYPLRPFVTVRPPTLAVATAALGGPAAMTRMLSLLASVSITALVLRLRAEGVSGPLLIAATVLLAAQAAAQAQPLLAVSHELWAALLVSLALACRAPGRWHASLLLGLLAVAVRELALPLPAVMAVMAAVERQRTEALAWTGALLLALLLLALHATGVAAVRLPGDTVSPGWTTLGGWRFDLTLARDCTLLTLLPWWMAAVLVPLALLGWAARSGKFAARVSLLLGLWLGAFLMIGRSDNDYWGLLISPLLTVGLVLAPAALRDLVTPSKLVTSTSPQVQSTLVLIPPSPILLPEDQSICPIPSQFISNAASPASRNAASVGMSSN